MAQAANTFSRFHNLSNEALADALGHADAVLKGTEAECKALKDEIKRRGASDAKLLELEIEIDRLFKAGRKINRERVDPHSKEFKKLVDAWHMTRSKADTKAMCRFAKKSGRDAAIRDADKLYAQADKLIRQLWALPPASSAGRAAKVRVFFKWVALDHFNGPDADLDWDNSLARQLLLEYAGLSEAEAVKLTSETRF
jgi:hypothetical protein